MHSTTKIFATLLLPALPLSAPAYEAVLKDHADLGLAYQDGAWDLQVHNHDTEEEFAPSDALLHVGALGRTTRPAGSQFDFLGNDPGDELWVLPFTQNPNLLYLGLAAEETEPGTFATYLETDLRLGSDMASRTGEWVKLTLTGLNAPGHLSIYTFDSFGQPIVWWSSAQGGITAEDTFFTTAGGHDHYYYAFTSPGIYEVSAVASAYEGPGATNLNSSATATFHFGVETIPEPGSALLLGGGVAMLGLGRLRNARQARATI